MELETNEKLIYEGGRVLYFKGIIKRQGTDKIYLTNKRVFTKVSFPIFGLFMKGISISLGEIISVEKAKWVMDDSLLFNYNKKGTKTTKKISMQSMKKRDEFYAQLKKLIPNKCR